MLGVECGVDDNFFDLGGHSLNATRLVAAVRSRMPAEFSLRILYDAPTPQRLATHLESSVAPVRPELHPLPRPAQIPAAPAQERLLLVDRLGETGTAYNYPLAFRVRGALDTAALHAALGDVVDRHEALRTVFVDSAGRYHQQVRPAGTRPPLDVLECTEAGLDAAIATAIGYRFDLTGEIPIRATVLRLGPDDQVVVALLHHIVTDEWSDRPFVTDLNQAYRAHAAGAAGAGGVRAALPVQYADYTRWQRELLDRIGAQQLDFWRTAIAGAPDEVALPTDRPRPSRPSGAGGLVRVELPPETTAALRVLAARRQVGALLLLHTAVAVLLHRLGAGDDIVLGTPVAGRAEAALDDLVGCFVNTVVLRADLTGDPSLDELLTRIRAADLAAFDHQELPFDRLVDELNPPRVAGRNPLFNVCIGYQLRDGADAEMFDLPTEWLDPQASGAMFDLGCTLIDSRAGSDDRASLVLDYSADLFDESTIRDLTRRLSAVLAALGTDPAQRVSAVDLLLPGERDRLLTVGTGAVHSIPPATLADLVSDQAQRAPDAPAVLVDDPEHGNPQLTYRELDAWSDRLAGTLPAAGAIVGVAVPRSLELIVALVAVAKSGAAFLPLDPSYPAERLAAMLADATPGVVLDAPAVRAARTAPTPAPRRDIDPAAWAYVLYTSGSTGTPKGVAVAHAGIVNRIGWLQHAYPLGAGDRMLVKTPIGFDVSVPEVFWPLSAGATLIVARPDGHRDPAYLAELIGSHAVTAVDFVPSMLELFLDEPRAAHCRSLKQVTVGGEALRPELAARFAATLDVPLHNLYGPTEASVDVLAWTADGGPVALGTPGWNVRAYVLDGHLNLVPVGARGELYLAGVQLADGYLHRSGSTAQRFVADLFGSAGRMYRTGDLVRRRTDGLLEYLGRTDDQIKLRGIRIEPGDIEMVLARHPAVASAHVVVRGERLIAYYLPAAGAPGADRSLRDYVTTELPAHMVPAAFVELAEFPLTPSGKLDRRALPDPEFGSGAGRLPETESQRRLCGLFAEVLGVSVSSIDDDFFVLGGHSLLLVRLAAAIRREFGTDVPVAELIVAPTVAEVATRLTGGDATDSLAPLLPLRTTGSAAPLFCIHPASGLAWQFAGLKPYLPPEIPIYGLQSPRFSGGEIPDTIAELAVDYADTVAAVAPTGPIRLLGWSFGGSMALLVGQELSRRGRSVSFVGMLDTRIGGGYDRSADAETVLVGLLREMGFPVDPTASMSVPDAVELIRSSDDPIRILDDAQIALVVENYIAAEKLAADVDYGRYRGDVFFVDATVLEMELTGVASHDWHDRVDGELRITALACRHSELLDADVLSQLGPVIANELSR
ncbi:amino acid adenylation domain-containing protein [Skermania piniformis]|uniref:non-ribosomal peptide synthetase n=1 Tax=Skermania pinensis TaxID=39122 RepID=UPI001FEBF0B4|nr:amino acid adenylation domain-containing protein [Skermania piniformis]